ncbi:Fumarate lyase:Adenylosuccinate lyase [Prochlorococcus marinus subsp. pastoris str. CCMP1986]|uniref:Adenylosuccinate lyase n=2 Tax=Prochlorococcus TaxID=1218 RepID=Q7TU40_PROMP|nr:adenylosuccinate lyase [Prochlorococcus marinus]CAE19924.1 Fumarate lyase:Adenylosuccinate lyase [Prochlorococcus marinus subsp. pastoris str. CCMP1986]
MIERYTLPEMGRIWTENAKFQSWLKVEIAACEANCTLGKMPEAALKEIRLNAKFEESRIKEIEKEVKHDVIAFLTNINEYVGDSGRYIHVGMTSSDILDTGLSLQLKDSCELLLEEIEKLENEVRSLARKHKNTLMIGRSHAIHGEPISFGFKLAGWLAEILRDKKRLLILKESISIGQISGAMGTYANTNPEIEKITCELLGLKPDTASTQVISRDRHAEYVQTIALIGASLDRFATEIRNLQRTDVLEVEEGFSKGQKGSSAMPHKRNPIRSERVSGLSRILRSYVVTALENVPLWHERDISHSSNERIMLPDVSICLHFMLREMKEIINNLKVYPDNMLKNLNIYGGVIFSQKVLLLLVEKGMSREKAYSLVQKSAHQAWNNENGNFKENIEGDQEIMTLVSENDLKVCFDPSIHLNNLNVIWDKLSI